MQKYKQKILPAFKTERILVRKVIPHKRGGVIIRFRTITVQRYRIRLIDVPYHNDTEQTLTCDENAQQPEKGHDYENSN